jgi:hypothetical protein
MREQFPMSEHFGAPGHEVGEFYASNAEAREFMEKFLSLQGLPSYECISSAKWDPDRGIIHKFEVEVGTDVTHEMRKKLNSRVTEFIRNEIQTMLYGY